MLNSNLPPTVDVLADVERLEPVGRPGVRPSLARCWATCAKHAPLSLAAAIVVVTASCERLAGPAVVAELAPEAVAVEPFGIFADGTASWVNQLPSMGMLSIADTQQTSAFGYRAVYRGNAHGHVSSDSVSQKFLWSSSNPSVASIDAAGIITAHSAGTASIVARSQRDTSRAGSVKVSVLDHALRFVSVSAGTQACAIDGTGAAWCWGEGTSGNAVSGLAETPVRAPSGEPFTSVAVGGYSLSQMGDAGLACALTATQKLYCWGDNGFGQLGTSTPSTDASPTPVSGAYAQIATGAQAACALTVEGAAYCWGYASDGLGTGSGSSASIKTPSPVAGSLRFRSIAVGKDRACGVAADDTAYCWGASPSAVPGSVKFSQVAVGPWFTCGVSTSNRLYCWGNTSAPAPVAATIAFTSVSASPALNSACALATDGRAYCFSAAADGTVPSSAIAPVQTPSTFTSLTVGWTMACGMSGGKVYCWRGVTSLATRTPSVAKGQASVSP